MIKMKLPVIRPWVCIVVVILLSVCGVAAEDFDDEYYFLSTSFISYQDQFVSVVNFLPGGERECIVIMMRNEFFISEDLFKTFFKTAASKIGGDTCSKIKAYGLVNGEGYFGEWTPARGYRYYWNT